MIRVLVVDDSPSMRRILTRVLESVRDIEVVGAAKDPYEARTKIVELKPDVITLDIEMPRMDGLTFLDKLMQHYPLPVVIISSFTPRGSTMAIRALERGAVEVIEKPDDRHSLQENGQALARKIRLAAMARLRRKPNVRPAATQPRDMTETDVAPFLLAIGASTGGPEALRFLLSSLPPVIPGTVIVQHMPKQFTAPFAKRLNEVSAFDVHEAEDGERLRPGLALVAPGGRHLLVRRMGESYQVVLRDGPQVFHQRPSVEVLFNAAAKAAGDKAVGVLLTGMGADGARGLLTMRQAGARTIAQDAASSVVYGMPKVAAELGAAETVAPLSDIPSLIMDNVHRLSRATRK